MGWLYWIEGLGTAGHKEAELQDCLPTNPIGIGLGEFSVGGQERWGCLLHTPCL